LPDVIAASQDKLYGRSFPFGSSKVKLPFPNVLSPRGFWMGEMEKFFLFPTALREARFLSTPVPSRFLVTLILGLFPFFLLGAL